MITPSQIPNPYVKPRWQAPVGIMEQIVAYNCRKHGFPRPVLAMPMWEGAGNRVLDYSGHGNHGINNGADWVPGGLKFVATNSDYVSCQQVVNGYPFTMVITVSKNTDASAGYISIADSSNSYYHILANQANNETMLRTYDGTTRDIYGDNSTIGKSYQLAGVWGANNDRKFYINGNFVGQNSTTESGNVGYNTTKIGTSADSTPWYYLDGNVYNAIIYNVALSAAQVKFLYDNPYFMYRLPEELYGYAVLAGCRRNPFYSPFIGGIR